MRHDSLRVKCTCRSEYQDQRYGKGVRVATPVNKSRQNGVLREATCTQCGAKHPVK